MCSSDLFPSHDRGQTKWQLTKLLYENWIDGYKYYGKYVNERTINYVSKYMTKKDEDNPDYISIVLCSKGLGANYSITSCGFVFAPCTKVQVTINVDGK